MFIVVLKVIVLFVTYFRKMNRIHFKIYRALFFCLIHFPVFAQNGLTKGATLPNLEIKKILNHDASITSLDSLQNRITVIDFFGTWCAPCIRALPHLTLLQDKYKQVMKIVLVSAETEAQLMRFLGKRKDLTLPVIVDADNQWNQVLQPPSLPYTVVINEHRQIIEIVEAEGITESKIQQWLDMKPLAMTGSGTANAAENKGMPTTTNQKSTNSIIALAQQYMYAAKTGEPITQLAGQLDALDYGQLKDSLRTEQAKKAFWINLYNGYTQVALKENPGRYRKRTAFFGHKGLKVSGIPMSLDFIEHAILRRSKIKWSMGYLNKLFPSRKEKDLRVANVDYRIHFALNCGAKSCPPIAFYREDGLEAQLNLATMSYLTGVVRYDAASNTVRLPRLMSWFRADFGGKKGMLDILKLYQLLPPEAQPRIVFLPYDWTLDLNNYTNQNHE